MSIWNLRDHMWNTLKYPGWTNKNGHVKLDIAPAIYWIYNSNTYINCYGLFTCITFLDSIVQTSGRRGFGRYSRKGITVSKNTNLGIERIIAVEFIGLTLTPSTNNLSSFRVAAWKHLPEPLPNSLWTSKDRMYPAAACTFNSWMGNMFKHLSMPGPGQRGYELER